ncbi:hypothetical protein VOLCADRAFT_117231, partial [Volvox carteri f. nagariensis]
LLDLDEKALLATAQELATRHPGASIRTSTLDVTDPAAQRAAFKAHVDTYGGLQLVVLNAGIGERGTFFDPNNTRWQTTLDVNLTAVLHGIKIASELMMSYGGGAILAVASAGAVFPMPVAPVYAAAKAGVAHFVRSAARGLVSGAARRPSSPSPAAVRLMALCPEFVETPLVTRLMKEDPALARRLLGSLDIKLLPPAFVASVARRAEWAVWATMALPREYKKIVITSLSSNFRGAARLVAVPLGPLLAPPPGQLLVRRVTAGVNASDINYSSGRYHTSSREAESKLPFDAGFESVNVVVAVGEGVTGFAPGDCVAALSYGSFSEYGIESARTALPVPSVAPEVVALLTSKLARPPSAAAQWAAGTPPGSARGLHQTLPAPHPQRRPGQFAVQLAKAAGCRVVATCGGPDKAQLLRELGVDRVIDYTKESVKDVLKREFPSGVDVVYESVGGMMSSYGSGWAPGSYPGLAEKLLWKSAAAVGFFLLRYAPLFKSHLARLVAMWEAGRLKVAIDPRVFMGVESVFDAVEHLHSGRSVGKVVYKDLTAEAPVSSKAVHIWDITYKKE